MKSYRDQCKAKKKLCDVMHLAILMVLFLLVSACVNTAMQKDQQSTKNTSLGQICPPGTALKENKKTDNNQQLIPICVPKGIITITDNYYIDPASKDIFNQAVVLLREQKYKMAIVLFEEITAKASKFSGLYINLGVAYARINKLDKAEESLKKALKLNKTHPVANNEIGQVLRKTGRYAKAREIYEALLKIYPDFLPARKNLGVLCDIYMQDLECALEQYETYLHTVPDDGKVKIWIADVKSRM